MKLSLLFNSIGLIALLSSCGQGTQGFLTEANVCAPDLSYYKESAEQDAAEQGVAMGGTSSSLKYLAQKSSTFSSDAILWGMELRLKAESEATDLLYYDFMTGHSGNDLPSSGSLTPESRGGEQVLTSQNLWRTIGTNFSWVKAQFRSPVSVAAGDYAWIILSLVSPSTSVNSVSWATVAGTGMLGGADFTHFEEQVSKQARYRFIPCKK